MREIKFRAWCESNKEMYYPDGQYEFWVDNNSVGFYPRYDKDEMYDFNTIPAEHEKEITVMQYTGLKDNFGNEIYEGDIIGRKFFHNNPPSKRPKEKYKYLKLPVIFDSGEFRLADYDTRSSKYGTTYGKWWQGCEVFGNVYQNPELLTQ